MKRHALRIVVRPARREDAASIAALARELAASVQDPPPRLTARSVAAALFSPSAWSECFVASKHGNVIGYILASRYFEAHTATRQLRIADLFVNASVRRAGIGRRLYAALSKRARTLHCQEIAWEVWSRNHSAFQFFAGLGAERNDDVALMRIRVR
ncbi:MAG: GNAT family N-acetyltransferase [Candidatus Eremiobacteraeota bacterium]|nr:GNAT family N-acetyltransferase [Candidatus Eremiobacteraeota bacterium]